MVWPTLGVFVLFSVYNLEFSLKLMLAIHASPLTPLQFWLRGWLEPCRLVRSTHPSLRLLLCCSRGAAASLRCNCTKRLRRVRRIHLLRPEGGTFCNMAFCVSQK